MSTRLTLTNMVYFPHVSNVKTTMFCHYHFFSSIINKIVIWCWYCFEFDMYQFFFATFGWHFSISRLRFINPVTSTPGTQKPGITTLLIYPAVLTNSCFYNRQLYDKNIFICESTSSAVLKCLLSPFFLTQVVWVVVSCFDSTTVQWSSMDICFLCSRRWKIAISWIQ